MIVFVRSYSAIFEERIRRCVGERVVEAEKEVETGCERVNGDEAKYEDKPKPEEI